MEINLNDLVKMSRGFGQNPEYIIAGGGNSSFKTKEKVWVKASGSSMADIDEDGFVCLDREKMQVLSEKVYSKDSTLREQEVKQDLQNAILFPEGKRPSVEASMHEVIQYAFVMHTHPTLVNGVLCAQNSCSVIEELFGDNVVYVPYMDPGYVLFKAVVKALQEFKTRKGKEAQIIFLENHGVFVGADTKDEIDRIYADIESKLNAKIKACPSDKMSSENKNLLNSAELLAKGFNNESVFTVIDNSELVQSFIKDEEAFSVVSIPFTPDNIVYCKSKYLFVSDLDTIDTQIEAFKTANGYNPKVIAVEGKGLVCVEESVKSATIVMDVFKDMMKVCFLSESFGGPRPMTAEQIEFIDNWEVENYRRQVSKQSN